MTQEKIDGLIVAGPTASGKSSYALRYASDHRGTVINADSIQLYQGLPLLTAQPSPEERAAVPHKLYEHFAPVAPLCSAAQWVALAEEAIGDTLKEGRAPIVVGGTGFYIHALTQGLSNIPSVAPEILRELSEHPTAELHIQLQKVDPVLGERLVDRQRIIRALSVFKGTGKPLSFWQAQPRRTPRYRFKIHLLEPPRERLHRKIKARFEEMIAQGALEEVTAFVQNFLNPTDTAPADAPPVTRAIGFRELKAHLDGQISLEEAHNLMLIQTRQYAKRQSTWFRHQLHGDDIDRINRISS